MSVRIAQPWIARATADAKQTNTATTATGREWMQIALDIAAPFCVCGSCPASVGRTMTRRQFTAAKS